MSDAPKTGTTRPGGLGRDRAIRVAKEGDFAEPNTIGTRPTIANELDPNELHKQAPLVGGKKPF